MGLIINTTDFVDAYELNISGNDTIDAYIDKYELQYLRELLGVELYKLFRTDYDSAPAGSPTDQIYKDIIDPINEDDNGRVLISEGMKNMLLGFIWFEYVRITAYKHSDSGVITGVNEISQQAKWGEGFIYKRYNESIRDYCVIQWFINDNSSDYPTFNGQAKRITGVI